MIKRLLLKLLSNEDFAIQVFAKLFKPQLFSLSPNNAYILVIASPLSNAQEEALVATFPSSITLSLIHGASAQIIELTNEK